MVKLVFTSWYYCMKVPETLFRLFSEFIQFWLKMKSTTLYLFRQLIKNFILFLLQFV